MSPTEQEEAAALLRQLVGVPAAKIGWVPDADTMRKLLPAANISLSSFTVASAAFFDPAEQQQLAMARAQQNVAFQDALNMRANSMLAQQAIGGGGHQGLAGLGNIFGNTIVNSDRLMWAAPIPTTVTVSGSRDYSPPHNLTMMGGISAILPHSEIRLRLALLGVWGYFYAEDRQEILVLPRPNVRFDTQGRPHCDDGPAVIWPRDGHPGALPEDEYHLHGIRVPKKAVMGTRKDLADCALGEGNAEVRRVCAERYGTEQLMKDRGIAAHTDDYGKLWAIVPSHGPRRQIENVADAMMVEVENSTPEPDGSRRTYFLKVPPNMRTAKAAVAWTFGLEEKDYEPEVQT